MQNKKSCLEKLYLPLILLGAFAAAYLLAYLMAQKSWTDIAVHMEIANSFLDGVEKNANPGFYLVFGFLTRVWGIPQTHGTACAMGMYAVLTGLAVYVIAGCVLGWNAPERTRCLVVLTCCSLVFKPSAPTLTVIYGMDFLLGRRSVKNCLLDALMFLTSVALILYQMFTEIGGEESGGGMFISFGRGWSYHTDSIFRSVMVNAIFLLFVCIL